MNGHIKVTCLAVMKINDAFEVFVLCSAHVVVEHSCVHVNSRKIFCDCGDDSPGFINLGNLARRATDNFPVAGTNCNFHNFFSLFIASWLRFEAASGSSSCLASSGGGSSSGGVKGTSCCTSEITTEK